MFLYVWWRTKLKTYSLIASFRWPSTTMRQQLRTLAQKAQCLVFALPPSELIATKKVEVATTREPIQCHLRKIAHLKQQYCTPIIAPANAAVKNVIVYSDTGEEADSKDIQLHSPKGRGIRRKICRKRCSNSGLTP